MVEPVGTEEALGDLPEVDVVGPCGTVPDAGGGVNGGGFGPAAFGEEGLEEVEGRSVFGGGEEEDAFCGRWRWRYCCCCC